MMTRDNVKLPYAVSEYIARRFREEFLFDLKEYRPGKGWNYLVEVSKDGYIHSLYFDGKGALVNEQSDPAFPADPHEGPLPEDVPE